MVPSLLFVRKGPKVTPQELLARHQCEPYWIHGSDIGVDESGGLWVRASARLKTGLLPTAQVQTLAEQTPDGSFREFSILTSTGVTILNPRDRTEPLWKHVHELKADAIGQEWIAVG